MARAKTTAAPPVIDEDAQAREVLAQYKAWRATTEGKLTAEELKQRLMALTPEKRAELERMNGVLRHRVGVAEARLDFAKFVKRINPDDLPGKHFDILTKAFHRIADGEEMRLIINIAPRRGKSERSSYLFPAWYIGRFPKKKIMAISNVKTLASDFGAKIRNLMDTDEYKAVFPNVRLAKDAQAKDKWRTNYKGEYFAGGVGSTVYGRGADILLIDDLHSEIASIDGGMEPPSKDDYDAAWNWYQSILSRLHPKGSILVVMQRWSKHDLTGRLIDAARRTPGSHQWEVITVPALEETKDFDGNITYESTWPEYWSTKSMVQLRETMMAEPGGAWRWNSMYQQNPGADSIAMFKRDYWKRWDKPKPPACEFIIQSWDMAAGSKERSNYSACTTWGVFSLSEKEDKRLYNIILLDAERGKWDFPDLKKAVMRKYDTVVKDGHPDCLLVENKSAGMQLIQELKATGIPVTPVTPGGNQWMKMSGVSHDKVSRANRVLEMFTSGLVWAPHKGWAEEVIEECANFPDNGQYDDYVDTMTQALTRFREGGFIRFDTDEEEEEVREQAPVSFYNLG